MIKEYPQEAVLAYLAGIIDGEGTIRIGKMKVSYNRLTPAYYGSISCGMTELPALRMLSSVFGGKIRVERAAVRYKPMYRWGTCGSDGVARMLRQLYPYLLVKKKQAAVVLDFCMNKTIPYKRQHGVSKEQIQWREELYQKVRKLNAVGALATTEYQGPEKGCDSLASHESVRE